MMVAGVESPSTADFQRKVSELGWPSTMRYSVRRLHAKVNAVIVGRRSSHAMKASVACFAALLLLSAKDGLAQGVVTFRNDILLPPPDRLVRWRDGTPLVGTTFAAQLLYGTDRSNLQPHPTLAYFRAPTTGSPGTWAGGSRTLTGVGGVGTTIFLQVRAWDSGPNRTITFDAARAAGGLYGQSQVFSYQQMLSSPPNPPEDTKMHNFAGFRLDVCRLVRITQPASGVVRYPDPVTFESESTAPEVTITNVTYLSMSGGEVFGQADTPPFAVSTNLPVGDYWVQAVAKLDTGDTCASDPFLVRVMVPPNPVVTPATYTALRGSTMTFTALPGGSEPNSYAWHFQNDLITNASGASLTLSNVSDAMNGFYQAVVSNAVGIATSAPVTLKVRSVVVLIDDNPIHTPSYTSSVPVTVRLVTSYPRGTIFYTLDGSTPSYASQQYLGPFTVDRAVHLRAIAYSADFFESGEAEPVDISLPPLRYLSVNATGGGSVIANPDLNGYREGETVHLTALSSNGWSFLEWRGDASGTNPEISLVMNSDRCVRALFGTTLTTTVAGSGRVVLNPPGGIYPYGTVVLLYAVPATNSYFVLWGNYASGSDNPLEFLVTEPTPAVSSAFFPLSSNHVTFSALPDGLGHIDVVPRTNRYLRGQTVQLRAYGPFVRWSGDAAGMNPVTAVTLDESKLATAHFSKTPQLITDPCHIGYNSEGFYATLSGAWGTRYNIHFTDLLGSWHPLLTLTNSYGTTQFYDPAATNVSQRFYRAELADP